MDSKYEQEVIENIFKTLNNEQSLFVMGLSLAANDLNINLDSIGRYPTSESIYFFSNSISIIRELALLVVAIEKSNLANEFSDNTMDLFKQLKSELIPFDNDSLVKSVLKPIRDLSFHYNFNKSNQKGAVESVLDQLKLEAKISVGFSKDVNSPLGQRYLYADSFRTDIANKFLTEEIVSKISAVAVNVISFVDSLLNDFVCKENNNNV